MERVNHGEMTTTERSHAEASKVSNTSPTDVEEQLQLADGDAVLKCFSPLLNSLKMFGLYFTQASRRIHEASTSISGTTGSKVTRKWNGGRIYAMVIMVIFWLNAARMLSAFDKADTFGAVLLLKLAAISAALHNAFQHTACFVGSETGNLDRVFYDATLPKSDVVRYRRLAVIHTTVCWISFLADVSVFSIPFFTLNGTLPPFGMHIFMPDLLLVLAKVVTVLLLIFVEFTWFFSHSVNYLVTSVLYDQFRAMNNDFHRAINCRGEFQGSIRVFRRRHQQLSQSVQNADKFMMISNGAGFCCHIFNLILVVYCSIFFQNETVGQDAIYILMYVYWLASTLFGLTLTAGQGIVINHAVCVA